MNANSMTVYYFKSLIGFGLYDPYEAKYTNRTKYAWFSLTFGYNFAQKAKVTSSRG